MRSLHWLVALGAMCVMMATAIPLSVLSIFTPFVTASLGFATGPFQLYYTLLGIAMMLTMPVAGRLMKSWGARRLLVVGGLVSAVGLLLMSASQAVWHFYGAGVVLGLGVGLGCMFVPVVLVNSWFEARRGLVMGIVLAGTGVGGAALSQIVPRIIGTDGIAWRSAFIFLAGVMAIFTIAPALLLIRNRPAEHGLKPYGSSAEGADQAAGDQELTGISFKQAMRSGWFYLFYLMVVLMGIVIAIVQGLSVHFKESGLTDRIGLFMTVFTLGLVFWKIVLGVLVDVLGLRWAMISTLGLCAVACFFMPGTSNTIVLVAMMLAIAAGTANGTVVPPLIGLVMFGRREFAAIWGVGATAFSLGHALGTPLWGAVKDATGSYELAFRLIPALIACCIAGLLIAIFGGRRAEQISDPTRIA